MVTYRYGRLGWRVRYARNVRDILSGLPHKSRNSTADLLFPTEDHSDPLSVVAVFAHPGNLKNHISIPGGPLTDRQGEGTHHRLRVFHMYNTHPFEFLRSEETELDLLDGAQRRLGIREKDIRHGDGCYEDASLER